MKKIQKASYSLFGVELGRSRAARHSRGCAAAQSNQLPPVAGFTLIELLVVIAIIAILASLVLAAAGYVQKKGATSRTQAEIAALGAALESYKADNGDYPTNSDIYTSPTNNSNLVAALMPTNTIGSKVYYEFKVKSLSNGSYIDPFGYVYGYYYTTYSVTNGATTLGATNNGQNNYDLWSTAGTTTGNTNLWIKNW